MSISGNSPLTGHLLTLFTTLVWGLTFVSTKMLLEDFTPAEVLIDRFFLGLAVLYVLYPRLQRLRSWEDELCKLGAAFFGVTFYFVLENNALRLAPAANVSLIVSTVPFFSGLLDRFIGEHNRLNPSFFWGMACALGGIALLGWEDLNLGEGLWGDVLALGAAVSWAFYNIFVRRLYLRGYDSLSLTRSIFTYALLLTLPLLLFTGYEFKGECLIKPANALNLIFLGVIATSLCFFTWNIAVRILGSVKTSIYLYGQPVVAALAAVPLLHEHLTLPVVTGIVLTVVGLIISQGPRLKHERQRRECAADPAKSGHTLPGRAGDE